MDYRLFKKKLNNLKQKNILLIKIIFENNKEIKNLDMNKMKNYYQLKKKIIKKKLINHQFLIQ